MRALEICLGKARELRACGGWKTRLKKLRRRGIQGRPIRPISAPISMRLSAGSGRAKFFPGVSLRLSGCRHEPNRYRQFLRLGPIASTFSLLLGALVTFDSMVDCAIKELI